MFKNTSLIRIIPLIYIFFSPVIAFVLSLFGPNHNNYFVLIIFPIFAVLLILINRRVVVSEITKWFFFYFIFTSIFDIARNEIFWSYGNFLTMVFFIYIDQLRTSDLKPFISYNYIKIIFLVSIIVIIIQAVVDPNFLVSDRWTERLGYKDDFSVRLSSIFSYLGFSASLFSFYPLAALVLHKELESDKVRNFLFYSVLIFLFAILAKGRSGLIYACIVALQYINYRKKGISNTFKIVIIFAMVFITSYYFLAFIGIPIDEIIFYRFLEGERSFEATSAFARVANYDFFVRNFSEFWLTGAGSVLDVGLSLNMNRRSNAMLIGVLDPFFRYGIIGFILFLIVLSVVLHRFYFLGKNYGNFAMFYAFLGFIVMNIFSNINHFFQMGIMIIFIFEKYYSYIISHQNMTES